MAFTPLTADAIPPRGPAVRATLAMAGVVAACPAAQLMAGGVTEAEVRERLSVGYRADRWEDAAAANLDELEELFFRGYFLPLSDSPGRSVPNPARRGCPYSTSRIQLRIRRQLLTGDLPGERESLAAAYNVFWDLCDALHHEATERAMADESGALSDLEEFQFVALSPYRVADLPKRGRFFTADFTFSVAPPTGR